MKCCKCKIETPKRTIITEGGQNYELCKPCSAIYDRINKTNYMHIFTNSDDHMSEEEVNMVNASRNRAKGNSPWNKKE